MTTPYKKIGQHTAVLSHPPTAVGFASVAGKREGEGPMHRYFDIINPDTTFGQKTWEKAESQMQKQAVQHALQKAGFTADQLDYLFAGDLLNQCISSTYGLRDLGVPMAGLFGACSTMAEGLALSSMIIDGGFAHRTAAVTSSHFCTAERQFRMPLEYGGQRPPTAQWTVTGSGCVVLCAQGEGPYVAECTLGRIIDLGVTDANDMGSAMAPSACDTLCQYFRDTGKKPADFDFIATGDLGCIGKEIVTECMAQEGYDMTGVYDDCGCMIYDPKSQDVGSGGSGCGCSAVVLTGYILPRLQKHIWHDVLFIGTGALMSPTACQQGESIPGIAHLVHLTDHLSMGAGIQQ